MKNIYRNLGNTVILIGNATNSYQQLADTKQHTRDMRGYQRISIPSLGNLDHLTQDAERFGIPDLTQSCLFIDVLPCIRDRTHDRPQKKLIG